MGELMLSDWPREAYPFEPAHGFFRRLARVNGQQSARVLAGLVGVRGRNVVPEEMLSFVTQFPVRNIENMARFEPTACGTGFVLNGEKLGRLDYSIRRPRYCAHCLRESATTEIGSISSCFAPARSTVKLW